MSTVLIIALLVAAVLAVASTVVLIMVIAGIHGEERRVSLPECPRSCSEIIARRVLDLHVSRPDARRILSGRSKDETSINGSISHPGQANRRSWRPQQKLAS
jgi:hypothetical protein